MENWEDSINADHVVVSELEDLSLTLSASGDEGSDTAEPSELPAEPRFIHTLFIEVPDGESVAREELDGTGNGFSREKTREELSEKVSQLQTELAATRSALSSTVESERRLKVAMCSISQLCRNVKKL
jgi:hypothetical protein